jgi:hypothetical protein
MPGRCEPAEGHGEHHASAHAARHHADRGSGVSPDTVSRFERGEELRESTLAKLRTACEKARVQFIDEDGGGAGVRLAKPPRRKRAK